MADIITCLSRGLGRSDKLQLQSSDGVINVPKDTPPAFIGTWRLEFHWSLDVGAWCFRFKKATGCWDLVLFFSWRQRLQELVRPAFAKATARQAGYSNSYDTMLRQ
jgi:hypothetical protein